MQRARLLVLLLAVACLVACSRGSRYKSLVFESLSSEPITERPAWLKQGIVMVGNWEPLTFRLRKGGAPVDVVRQWEAEHTEETVRRLKQQGVNLIVTNLHKGFGLQTEAQDIEATRKLVAIAHRYGIKVGGYIGASMFYETFFAEEPEASNWMQVNEWGKPVYYNPEQTNRYMACRNNPDYAAFIRRVLRLGVEDLKLDLIHFDQMEWWPEPRSCHCDYCREQFRAYLRSRYTPEQLRLRFGFTRLDDVVPPPFDLWAPPVRIPELNNPLMQEWARFRAFSLAQRYGEYDAYIHRLNPQVALEGNPNVNFALNKGFSQGVDLAQLLEHGDIVWSEEPNQAEWTADGRLVSKIRSFKAVRSMGKSLFVYTGGMRGASSPRLRMAEAMAYNDMNLGDVGEIGALRADGASITAEPEDARYIEFFHAHAQDLVDTSSVADAAVLRSFPAVEFNPARGGVSTILFEQTLIQTRVPFDIIFDRHLKDLAKYKVLVLADQDALSDAEVAQIRTFVENGGGLVATGDTSLYTDWRWRRGRFGLADLFGRDLPPAPNEPNRPVQRTFGKGRVVYLPRVEPSVPPPPPSMSYNFSKEYWKLPTNYRELEAAVEWAAGGRLSAKVDAPLSVTLELAEQKTTRNRLLHLVNYDIAKPIANLKAEVRIPEGMRLREAVLESPDSEKPEPLAAAVRDGVASFRIPRLKIYDLVLLRLEK